MTGRRDDIQGDIVHVCDGIEEADNKLPNWWLWTFYLAILFSLFYWGYYHLFGAGRQPMAAYEEEKKKVIARGANVEEAALLGLADDPGAVSEGKRIFVENCAQCHEKDGRGNIGPNLTDEYWIHGGGPSDIYKTVYNGVLDKGMLAWGPTLGPGGVKRVAAYVLTIRNTNVPGKEPQGDKWQPGEQPAPEAGKAGAGESPETAPKSPGG